MSTCPRCEKRSIWPGHGELCLVCLKTDLRHVAPERQDDVPPWAKDGNFVTPMRLPGDET